MGELPCSDAILPILVRLELPLRVNTAVILQQSALLQARSPPYSAVGGETTFFKGCTDLVRRLAHAQPSTVLPPYTTVGADAARFLCGWCAKLKYPTPP